MSSQLLEEGEGPPQMTFLLDENTHTSPRAQARLRAARRHCDFPPDSSNPRAAPPLLCSWHLTRAPASFQTHNFPARSYWVGVRAADTPS